MNPAGASWRVALVGVVCVATPAWSQTGALATARDALTALDEGFCREAVPPGVWEVRLALVVYPDGGWSVAVGPMGALVPPTPTAENAARVCATRRLAETLAPRLPRPPRATAVLTRMWRFSTTAQRALTDRLEGTREVAAACIARTSPGAQGTVRLWVSRAADGSTRARADAGTPLARAVSRCVVEALGVIPPVEHEVAHEVNVNAHATPIDEFRTDGTAGAVCSWGGRDHGPTRRAPPVPCRAGLRCCSGGAAGSDGVCLRVAQCPLLP